MSTSLWEFRPCPCTEEAQNLYAGELPAIQMGQLFLALCIQMWCPIKKQVVLRRWYHVHIVVLVFINIVVIVVVVVVVVSSSGGKTSAVTVFVCRVLLHS